MMEKHMTQLARIPADKVIAHRGYQRHYPENSLTGILKAIECGALFIEIDVQFSADGIPILYHDADLQRISGVHGKLTQYHWRALQEFTAGEPGRFGEKFSAIKITPLSALVELMKQHPAVQVLVELKEEAVRDYGATVCLATLREVLAPAFNRCTLISFAIDALYEAQRMGFQRLAPVLRDWSLRKKLSVELEAELVIINHQRIPKNESLIMDNCGVAVYEIDDIALAASLLERGARLIETFAIGEMLGVDGISHG
jgi:glycerophosphoryl diester phosphodiesterase